MLSALFLATVIGISDEAALTVLNENKQQVKIRLAEIDAPKARQPFGAKSKQSFLELCFGKQAQVKPQVKDRYGRTVARVTCDGVDANAEQVNRGMAWVYRKYKDHNLYVLQQGAKSAGRGLWSEPSPMPPWEWRQSVRHAAIQSLRYA
jgi:micrococcal nuclease